MKLEDRARLRYPDHVDLTVTSKHVVRNRFVVQNLEDTSKSRYRLKNI